jgi:outer membrane protein TolC
LGGDATRFLDDGSYNNYNVGLEIQTPIMNRAEKARHERARLSQDQSERYLDDLENALAAEVRRAAIEAERQWQRIAATQLAVRSRTEELRIAQGRNAAGKTTNLDLLLVQRSLIQAEVDEVTARVNYIQALTSLYAAEGTLLERRGIALDLGNEKE